MIGRRRPLARAAMIGGGAYMVGKSNQKKNQQNADQEARIEQLEAQQQAPAPVAAAPAPVAAAPAAAGGDDLAGQISQLRGCSTAAAQP